MSFTPIEGETGTGEQTPDESATPGVRRLLYRAASGLVSGVLDRLPGPFPRGESGDVTDDHPGQDPPRRETTIQPSGQARLEGEREEAQLVADTPPDPPVVVNQETPVEATVDDDTLRLHQPDSTEAYITSDVYRRIER
jgi:hypothetical protein